ncbi:MAG: efflux RND transporter periplasmic adaptor subunit [Bacteroidaceae bacterium]|nr:efflux RND transporter periplasmic adaptor subunit [Bacteroidaceae bacterium]
MKYATSPLLLLATMVLLTACGGSDNTTSEGADPATVTPAQPAATSESPAADSLQMTADDTAPHSLGGTITVDPDKYASVTVLMGGTVGRLAVRPGQFVHKGSVVATLNNPDFVELQQTYLDAVAQTEFLAAEYQRQQALTEGEAAAKKTLQQSKAAYLSMKTRKDAAATRLRQLGVSPELIASKGIISSLAITAPISGYVGDIAVNIGKYVDTGDRICSIIDQNASMLRLTAFSHDINAIKVGTPLTFTVKMLPGETFNAVVSYIDPIIDESSNSTKVYAKITSAHRKFQVGMYVRAKTCE